jgi:hypothetical protein
MLTLYANTLVLLITLCPSLPYDDMAGDYTARITGNGRGEKVWIYDGSVKRSNLPGSECETWTFRAKTVNANTVKTVTIKPCQDAARESEWNIYWDEKAGYNKIAVDGRSYIITIEDDSSSQIKYMEFEDRPPAQGAKSLHKYFHAGS